jgi:hypothetical protein
VTADFPTIALESALRKRQSELDAETTPAGGIEALLFYLIAYGAMTVGAFGVVAYLSGPERQAESDPNRSLERAISMPSR